MATDLHSTTERLLGKTAVLVEKYNALLAKSRELELQIEALEKEVNTLKKEREVLSQDNEYLRIARTISPSFEQMADSKAVLSQLVREIDKCISQLTCK